MQRPELTHLVDSKAEGVADRYETTTMDFGFVGNYHEFAYGPAKDKDGYLYFSLNLEHNPDAFKAAYMARMRTVRIAAGSSAASSRAPRTESSSLGLRHALAQRPGGVARGGHLLRRQPRRMDRRLLAREVREGRFYGNPSSMIFTKDWNNRDPKTVTVEELGKKKSPPAIVFPYGRMGQSLSQPTWDTSSGSSALLPARSSSATVQIPIVMRRRWRKSMANIRAPATRSSASRSFKAPTGCCSRRMAAFWSASATVAG